MVIITTYNKKMITFLGILACGNGPVPPVMIERVYAEATGNNEAEIVDQVLSLWPSWFTVTRDGSITLYHDRLRAWVLLRWSNRDLRERLHGSYVSVMERILEVLFDEQKEEKSV